MISSMEMRVLVLQLQRTESCHNHVLQMRTQLSQYLELSNKLSGAQISDLPNCELEGAF